MYLIYALSERAEVTRVGGFSQSLLCHLKVNMETLKEWRARMNTKQNKNQLALFPLSSFYIYIYIHTIILLMNKKAIVYL